MVSNAPFSSSESLLEPILTPGSSPSAQQTLVAPKLLPNQHSEEPYFSFIDDPDAFPISGGLSQAIPEPPLAEIQDVPLPVPAPQVPVVPQREQVIKYRLSLVLPAFSPRHFHIWENT